MCVRRIKNINFNNLYSVNEVVSSKINERKTEYTYYTSTHQLITLLDTGAEINVVKRNALEKIPTSKQRKRTTKQSYAQSAGRQTIKGLGTVEIQIQGYWNKFQIWEQLTTDIIVGQPILKGEIHISH